MPELFLEKRRFPRVTLPATGLLVYRDEWYCARLENISLTGALVRFHDGDGPAMAPGERCSLELYRGGRPDGLRLETRLVHLGFGMACVRFTNLNQDTRIMLRSMISHQMPQRHASPARSVARHG